MLLLKLKSYHGIQSQRVIVQLYFLFHAVSCTMRCDAMHDKIIRVQDYYNHADKNKVINNFLFQDDSEKFIFSSLSK